MTYAFDAEVVVWRGPAPFVFALLPPAIAAAVRQVAAAASYGWGVVPVEAEVRGVTFRTSLFPRDGGYLLPLKLDVRRRAGIEPDETLGVTMRVCFPE